MDLLVQVAEKMSLQGQHNMPKQVTVYEWDEVEKELCKILGIEQKYFRDYHLVVGGGYKDCWHTLIDEFVIPESMRNGSIVTMYWYEDLEQIERLSADEGWKIKVLVAWNQWYDSVDTGNDSGVLVEFNW